ncbi:hypothetical protein [Polyangium spumosum]|uniref:Uncharacterized protein n=1 Tax=Polyangium spumosum TaxID=889282 RepID=A0A6N7PIV2_9BACT|nr:hypothetical protein [Polyangium spumosum]MRG91757.1 hypothetical protein [Polyangium spumosum]
MNVGRQSLGLGGLFALVAMMLTGCLVAPDESVTVDEAVEELQASASDSDDQADRGASELPDEPPPQTDDMPDPLPWTELHTLTPSGCDPQARSGPDPLPWEPPSGTQSSPGVGTKQD